VSLRDLVWDISPSWLRTDFWANLMYSLAIQFDALDDLESYAVRARFPDLAPPDAYPYIAQDRSIAQGYQETTPAWLERCKEWLDRWAHVGSPWGVLMGVRGVVSSSLSACATVTARGTWDSYADGVQDGIAVAPTHDGTRTNAWNWDSLSWPWIGMTTRDRIWVVLWPDVDTGWSRGTRKWDDGSVWDDGTVWDIDGATVAQTQALRAAVLTWKSGLTCCPCIILAWSAADFSDGGAGAQPDGHCGIWSKITTTNGRTTRVPSRYAGAAYLAGVA
jgi:hypothetical protein